MRHYRLYILAAIIAFFMAACQEQQTEVNIKIVCTSDVHGNFFPYDFMNDTLADGSLARVSNYLKQQRSPEAYGENVIYIDNGDILQGQPTSYFYNTVNIEDKHLAAEVLNYLKCDAATLGNHDIETGGPTYQRYIDDLECPILGGNIVYEGSSYTFVPPYTIVERSGVKVAILGLTTPAIPHCLPNTLWRGLEFEDMETAASRWMQYVCKHENPDIVIGLFHSGYEGGITTEGYAENATRAVAENVPGFDAIFYGHEHKARVHSVTNKEGRSVWLINPGNNAHEVGTLKITYRKGPGKNKEITLHPALENVDCYKPDEAYMSSFATHMDEVEEYVSRKIGTFTHAVSSRDAYFGPSDFVDFIHQMQLSVSGAQISFAAPLTFDTTLPEGDIFVRDMFNLYKYENVLYVMTLKGKEVKDYLEMSYGLWTNQMKRAGDHLLLFSQETSPEGCLYLQHSFAHFDSAAGIIYEVDVTKPVGQRVTILRMADGKPFSEEATYSVALNSFRGTGGGELLTKGAGIPHDELSRRIRYTTEIDLRYYMLNYIEREGTVNPQALHHWKFVPERWCTQAAARDRRLLFGR